MRAHWSGKCWKFTHTGSLPSQEIRGESIWLSLRTFLIGDLLSVLGTTSSGNRAKNGNGQSQLPIFLQKFVMQLLEQYFVRTLLKRLDKLTISNFLSCRNSRAGTPSYPAQMSRCTKFAQYLHEFSSSLSSQWHEPMLCWVQGAGQLNCGLDPD